MIKSPIAYPGAKGKVCDKLMAMLPDGIKDWREPFFGGGSVTIAFLQSSKGKDCKKFTVGDVYPELFLFWKGLQENPDGLYNIFSEKYNEHLTHMNELKLATPGTAEYDRLYTQVTEVEAKKLWAWVQSVEPETLSELERGARFLLSSKMSFSGVADSGGMSKERVLEIDLERMKSLNEVSKLLQRVDIREQGFESTISSVDEHDSFVFLDPPYITQEVGNLYGRNGSTHKKFKHEDLAKQCLNLKCPWLMTLDDCVKARKLYRGAYISEFYIPYTMTSLVNREDRLNGEEIIISNYYSGEDEAVDF